MIRNESILLINEKERIAGWFLEYLSICFFVFVICNCSYQSFCENDVFMSTFCSKSFQYSIMQITDFWRALTGYWEEIS